MPASALAIASEGELDLEMRNKRMTNACTFWRELRALDVLCQLLTSEEPKEMHEHFGKSQVLSTGQVLSVRR